MSHLIHRDFSRYVDIARALKLTSQTGRVFHCSFAVKQKKIVAIGLNNYNKTNRICAKYKSTKANSGNKDFVSGIHSEQSLLAKIKNRDDINKLTLLNIRIDNNGDLANSCPCPSCAWYVSRANFKKVIYSVEGGFEKFP